MKKYKKLTAIVAALAFSLGYSLVIKWWQGQDLLQESTMKNTVVFLLCTLILGNLGYKIFHSYSNIPAEKLKKKIIYIYLFFVLASLTISISLVCLGDYVYFQIKGYDTSNFMQFLLQQEIPGAIRSFFIWILVISTFLFYMIWRQAMDREQQLREENLKYKYKNLKTQVNPHFLFNSLNTLSEMIYTDVKRADNYIQKLSGIYRYILDHEESDLVPLSEELKFVEEYFELQKGRSGNAISLNIDFQDTDKFKIIPVSLQILVENAIKHNSMSKQSPLDIYIVYENNEYITVANVIQRKNTLDSSSGTGLSNLQERVRLIMGKEIVIKQENGLFMVQLPIIKA